MYHQQSVGSLESSDLLIKINNMNNKLEFTNLINNLDDQLIIAKIKNYLEQYSISDVGMTVHYNGANEWVIKSRIEALAFLIKGETNA